VRKLIQTIMSSKPTIASAATPATIPMDTCDQSMADGLDFKTKALPAVRIVTTVAH
jgi:hypothetical protein